MDGPAMLRLRNVDGDRQGDLRVLGSAEQAALLYSADNYDRWRAEGFDFEPGSFGENLTVRGLDETTVFAGDIYQVGEAVIQVTELRGPCYKLQYRTGVPDMIKRVLANHRSGWYVRVLQEGLIEAGQDIVLLKRLAPGEPLAYPVPEADPVLP
ncbi:MAG: MOSC domain-containing protein [Chloroflexota bacterium]